jgi:hypothetical protein
MKIKTIPTLGAVVKSGDVYEFARDIATRAGHTHAKGSLLNVHDATKDTPFGEISGSGTNWLCSTDFGISVWSTLESCVALGKLKKVE